jgi:large subunit ribosomal protein L23
MGLLDKFFSKKGKDDKRKHVVDQKKRTEEDKKKLFQSVPGAGKDSNEKAEQPREAGPGSTEKKSEKSASKAPRRPTGPAYRVLVRPLVTERGNELASEGQYLFAVNPHAAKPEIADAVERVYGVRPAKVNIMNVRGKAVRYGRTLGSTTHWKKAVVTLPKGKSIDVFEG